MICGIYVRQTRVSMCGSVPKLGTYIILKYFDAIAHFLYFKKHIENGLSVAYQPRGGRRTSFEERRKLFGCQLVYKSRSTFSSEGNSCSRAAYNFYFLHLSAPSFDDKRFRQYRRERLIRD